MTYTREQYSKDLLVAKEAYIQYLDQRQKQFNEEIEGILSVTRFFANLFAVIIAAPVFLGTLAICNQLFNLIFGA